MPTCGSQIPICDVPIRYDTYTGCTHACSYCFAKRLSDITQVGLGETPRQLLNFIQGKRSSVTSWCDWDIPIHWGGVSDPFQPCERLYRRSLESLKVFRETKYPYIVSTKATLPAEDEYLDIIKDTNVVFQVSMVSEQYNKFESGCPSFAERLEMVKTLTPYVKRMVIRAQPFVLEVEQDIIDAMPAYRDAGVYGIILEGMKYRTKRADTEKWYGDNVLKKGLLKRSFQRIKEEAHKHNLVFLCGENRLRSMSDDLTCCGCGGLEGFEVNKLNFNSFNLGREYEPTKAQQTTGTAGAFITMLQGMEHKYGLALKKLSFDEMMKLHHNKHNKMIS